MRHLTLSLLVLVLMPFGVAQAAGGGAPIHKQHWHFSGPFGTYDRGALQRGLKVYREVCAACHSMKNVSYRNLSALGYNENQIKNIAADYTVEDGPDADGDMFERPARPSDRFKSPFANENAAKVANNGAFPPDFSLISKARAGGADYLYALLTGYHHAPEGTELQEGQHWNAAMPGHIIAMAAPLSDGIVGYEDGSAETISQYSKDVSEFLTWASDPHMETRKQTGFKVIVFLLAFAGVMYSVKRKIWAKLH